MRLGLFISLILAVFATLFALQNPQAMEIKFFAFQVTGSTALILILSFALGVAVGLVGMLPSYLRSRRALKKLQEALSSEVDDEDPSRENPEERENPQEKGLSEEQSPKREQSPKEEAQMLSPEEVSSPPEVGPDPPSRMKRDSWWGTRSSSYPSDEEKSSPDGRSEKENQ